MYDKIILTEDPTMLIEFTVKNYASFKDKTTLSAETGNRLRKLKDTNTFYNKKTALLKSLLLFGPNGAGKSQLIHALGTMQSLITRPTQAVTDELVYDPFIFDDEAKNSDTFFEVLIEINEKIYRYSLSYNAHEIGMEKLSVIKGTQEINIFSRSKNDVKTSNKLLLDSVPKLRKNALFLFLAQSENDQDCATVFKWFAQDLMFINGKNAVIPEDMLDLMNDAYLKKEMISFLSFADFNISDILVREVPFPSLIQGMKLPGAFEKTYKELFTVHKIYNDDKVVSTGELPLASESVGTQRLFYIVLAMMLAQTNGNEKTIIIDEFDDSLHVELANALVQIFNSKENLNQFIITTHDIQLLDSNLRIDQIYLLDKDFHGISNLRSIFDFEDARNKGRRDISFAKRYLQGKFGAVPVIDVDGLLDVLQMIHEKYERDYGKKKGED